MRSNLFKILPALFLLCGLMLPTSDAHALRVFTCPDGSIPPNGVCPKPNPPKLSCANIRCTADSRCVETSTGPQCVPLIEPKPVCPKWSKYNQFTNRCDYQQPTYQWPTYTYPQPTYQWPSYQSQYQNYYWPQYQNQYQNYYQPNYGYNYYYQNW